MKKIFKYTELEYIAYELYRTNEKMLNIKTLDIKIFTICHDVFKFENEYYKKAEHILRNKKLKKLKNEN